MRQRWIMHIDMDAFFASVEQLDNPALRGKAVIVGGGTRGVVCAASYEARKFGVHSAMPIFQAKRLCPDGIFVNIRKNRYAEISREVMAVLHTFSPLVEQASVDEAYLDASGLERLFGPIENMAITLKKKVFQRTGLTCSIGVAPVKFLAKIASDMKKPNGLTIVLPSQVTELLAALPVSDIPGIGKKTLPTLQALGIRFAADVTRYPRDFWIRRLGKTGGYLFDRSLGKDERNVVPFDPPKSESVENTFEEDTLDWSFLKAWLLNQAERVGRSLRRQNLAGRTITLKAKYADFTLITRAKTLPEPTNSTQLIYNTAVDLLEGLAPQQKLRLIGVGVSHFKTEALAEIVRVSQLSLFEEATAFCLNKNDPKTVACNRQSALDAAMDAVRDKFGTGIVTRANALPFATKNSKHEPNAEKRSKNPGNNPE